MISYPNGYVIGNQPIEITIKSKETVVIDVITVLILIRVKTKKKE